MKKLIIIIIVISLFSCWYLFSREELLLVSNQFYFQTEERLEGKVELELLTYNIQRGIGLDGRLDLERTASVIRGSGADIIGLNEVDVRQAEVVSEIRLIPGGGPGDELCLWTQHKGYIGSYGNAILSRYPIIDVENIFLPVLEGSEGENRSS